MCRKQQLFVYLVLLTALHAIAERPGSSKGDEPATPVTCKPQGLLTFDPPYPRPRRTNGLPVCPQ
eukprot:scaffold51419_cov18-Tisochrysis_lutea.AAC.1